MVDDTDEPDPDAGEAPDGREDDEFEQLDTPAGDGEAASRARLVLAALGLLLIGLVIGRMTAPDEGDDGAGGGGGSTTNQADEPLPFPRGDTNRVTYYAYVGLTQLVVDTFDRADDAQSLGETGTGESWEAVFGTWGIEDNVAVRASAAAGAQSLAVVPQGEGDGLMEVTLSVVEPGAGLAFRYIDPENYWTVTANPSIGSWTVNRVIEGEPELIGELAAPVADGTTVTVTSNGPLLRFVIDGEEFLQLDDSTFEGSLQAGIVASADSAGDARWDRFLTMTTTTDAGADDEDGTASTTVPATTATTEASTSNP